MGIYRKSGNPHFAQKSEMARYLFQYCSEHKEGNVLLGYESVVHFLLVDRVIQESLAREKYKLDKVKRIINDDIAEHSCTEYWNRQLVGFLKDRDLVAANYSVLQMIEKRECVKWLLDKPNVFSLFCALRKIRKK